MTTSYDYQQSRSVVTHYDSLCGFHALNFILYQNSPRYILKKGARAWSCQGGFKPGDGAPPIREEAFPELWDQVPAGLLNLLVESGLESVHQFATKAFRANAQAMADVPTELVTLLLGRPFIVTARLGFELAQKKMENKQDLGDDEANLVVAASNSVLSDARKEGAKWVQEHRHAFGSRPFAMAKLIRSPFADTRKTIGDLLLGLVLDDKVAALVLEDVLRFFASLDAEENTSEKVGDDRGQVIQEAGETLLRVFARQAQRIPLDVVIGLLLHAIDEVQAFAAQVLLAHETRPKDLPEDLIPRLLQAKSDRVRNIGMRLFAELDDDTLLQKEDLFVQLATSKLEDMRKEVQPIIARLALRDADFGADLCARLVAFILRKEQVEGLHKDLSDLVLGSLSNFLSTLSPKTVWRLVHGRSSIAQDLGGHLLKECVEAKDLTVREIAKLASHDILSIREAAWRFYDDNVIRMKEEVADSIILLDAKADDSRIFGFAYFKEHFGQDDLSPAVMVAVCDSLRDDVQCFGRDLISRYFQDQDGPEYLLKLSEHPTQDLQLFATNYLERFADGDVERLESLRHYFLSILSRVNQGSVAKARVLAFLRGQANKSEALAGFVCELLTRQSLSLVERDRATMIEILLEIQLQWPKLENPLSLVDGVILDAQNIHEAA
ncbi:MAG: hypothetical protein GY822_08175 [Deltaproteobacteria bacterium]|nr:hypothetical protein [Deltaproteobacteria bacterium]